MHVEHSRRTRDLDIDLLIMERINLGYSLKNIPIPSKDSYMKILIDKTDDCRVEVSVSVDSVVYNLIFSQEAQNTSDTTNSYAALDLLLCTNLGMNFLQYLKKIQG